MAAVVVPLPADLAAQILSGWLDNDGADELLAVYEDEIQAVRDRARRDVDRLCDRGAQHRPAV